VPVLVPVSVGLVPIGVALPVSVEVSFEVSFSLGGVALALVPIVLTLLSVLVRLLYEGDLGVAVVTLLGTRTGEALTFTFTFTFPLLLLLGLLLLLRENFFLFLSFFTS